jgi:SAM-dependent methyltransferase
MILHETTAAPPFPHGSSLYSGPILGYFYFMEESVCPTRDRKIPNILTNNLLRYLFSPPERLVKKYVHAGEHAADLGCGAGFHTLPMARIVGREGRVYAVDFDPRAIAQLERKSRSKGYQGIIEARTASASAIDFIKSQSIHFVLAEGLLCCMTDHAGAVRQIRRVLHPAGHAYLSVIKLGRDDDPRAISKETWEQLLASFRLLDSGEGFLTRWALVGPGDGSSFAEQLFKEPIHAGRLPCC